LEVEAEGRSHHGAHVHLGDNAIERLTEALGRLVRLRAVECPIPASIRAAIEAASARSEAVSGTGETTALQQVTVSLGTIEGCTSVNIIPDRARARADIRFPPGVAVADIVAAIGRQLGDLAKIRHSVLSSSEPNWTDPDHEIVARAANNAAAFLGADPV